MRNLFVLKNSPLWIYLFNSLAQSIFAHKIYPTIYTDTHTHTHSPEKLYSFFDQHCVCQALNFLPNSSVFLYYAREKFDVYTCVCRYDWTGSCTKWIGNNFIPHQAWISISIWFLVNGCPFISMLLFFSFSLGIRRHCSLDYFDFSTALLSHDAYLMRKTFLLLLSFQISPFYKEETAIFAWYHFRMLIFCPHTLLSTLCVKKKFSTKYNDNWFLCTIKCILEIEW